MVLFQRNQRSHRDALLITSESALWPRDRFAISQGEKDPPLYLACASRNLHSTIPRKFRATRTHPKSSPAEYSLFELGHSFRR